MGLKVRGRGLALRRELEALGRPEKREHSVGFFQAHPGGYGEGDEFFGVVVPDSRRVARGFRDLPLAEVEALLHDPVHEVRLCALFVLVHRYQRGDEAVRAACVELYTNNLEFVNGWDLVDSSAHLILGEWLRTRDRKVLYDLAASGHLWRQRVAIIATLAFIRQNDFDDTLAIADRLLGHPHDLIHKAVGWMVREVGKRDLATMESFLKSRYGSMPRTMLRYAIEKLPEPRRRAYIEGRV